MEKETRIIEINGIKMEVDLRTAKVIENYRIGDSVKLLVESYGDKFDSHLGIIVGFDDFEKHPTIIVAYLALDYSSAEIKFAYINSGSGTKYEICPVNDWDVPFKKQDVLSKIDAEIAKKEEEIRDLTNKRTYFVRMFGQYFEKAVKSDSLK